LLASKLTSLSGRQAKILPGVCGTEFMQRPMQRNNNPLIIGFAGTSANIGQMNTLLGPSLAKVAVENIKFELPINRPKPILF